MSDKKEMIIDEIISLIDKYKLDVSDYMRDNNKLRLYEEKELKQLLSYMTDYDEVPDCLEELEGYIDIWEDFYSK